MVKIKSSFTLLFEEPFWVGVYERECQNRFEACKITFGAEPKDYEIYEWLLKNWNTLRFGPSLETAAASEKRPNPKRLQREITKQLENKEIGTKAQQALKLQQEHHKQDRRLLTREQKQAEKEWQFALRQEKRKAKR